MKIVFITDVDIGGQFYTISQAINKHTKHKARCITIAKNYLEHSTDIWLGTFLENGRQTMRLSKKEYDERMNLAETVIQDADFYVFRRDYFLVEKLTPFNHLMVTYGSEARYNPAPYFFLSEKQNVTHVTSLDYSQSSKVGFSCQHIPISLDLTKIPSRRKVTDHLRVVHAPTDERKKGTDYLIEALKTCKVENVVVKNKTWKESLDIKSTCDINFDQIWLGSYGMSSVESMAMYQPTLAYINGWVSSMYPDLPVVNVTKETLQKVLNELITSDELRESLGKAGRQFVEKYHDVKQTVKRWDSLIRFVYEEKRNL